VADEVLSEQRLHEMFAAIDAMDTTAFVDFLAPDATFQFGSAPAVEGRDRIATAVDGFFGTIGGLSHRIGRFMRDGDSVAVEGQVRYRRHDDSSLTLPFVTVCDCAGEFVEHYKIYIDIAPLYSP